MDDNGEEDLSWLLLDESLPTMPSEQHQEPVIAVATSEPEPVEIEGPVLEVINSIPTLPYWNSMLNMTAETEAGRNNPFVFNLVFVVGAGGTGGYVVRDLGRYVSTLPYSKYVAMVLMDEDEVESKNLIRQNFLPGDVGKKKVEVLAARYSKAFGINCLALPQHLTEENIGKIFSENFCQTVVRDFGLKTEYKNRMLQFNILIISCVDNNKTRTLISETLGYTKIKGKAHKNPFSTFGSSRVTSCCWIDSGNETSSGQVFVNYDTVLDSQGGSNKILHLFNSTNVNTGAIILGTNAEKACENWISTANKTSLDTQVSFLDTMREANTDSSLALGVAAIAKTRDFDVFMGHITPPVTWVYPDIFLKANDKLNTELSCEERAIADPQNIMVNVQAACYVILYATKFLASTPKGAWLNSFGCAWNGVNTKEFFMKETDVKNIFGTIDSNFNE
jgi:molybdopterin/thiamine biosynthesis adenylyltransferase